MSLPAPDKLRQILRQLLALVLMLSLLPGLVELVENVEHLLHDGHLAHGAQHDQERSADKHADGHDQGLDDEHGCTPMAHHCGCHSSAPAMLADAAPDLDRAVVHEERRLSGADQTPISRANAPPTRPPIA